MSTTLLRTSTAARAALRASSSKRAASMASTSFIRGKATLPDLPCQFLPVFDRVFVISHYMS